MNEEKSHPDAAGLSIIKTHGTCPKCGKTLDLDSVAFFPNSER
jgi:hypothetical protein